jgi:hypothetical protein
MRSKTHQGNSWTQSAGKQSNKNHLQAERESLTTLQRIPT